MNKNIVIISSSLRNSSNSEILAQSFATGAKEAKNQVEFISLKGKNIQFCTGCLSCQIKKQCYLKDDMPSLLEKIRRADVIVFSTPLYFYELSGQLKTFLDRTNPLFSFDTAFRDIYLVMTAADSDLSWLDSAIHGLEGWISCFEKTRLAGVIKGVGVNEMGEIKGKLGLLQQAYRMGKDC